MPAAAAALYGRVKIGGGGLELTASVGGGTPPVFSGSTTAPISFTGLIGDLLGYAYLRLPDDFPQILFEAASAEIIPSRSARFAATSNISWPKPFGMMVGVSLTRLSLDFASGGVTTTQIAFTCGVQYGNRIDLEGFIRFSGGTLGAAGFKVNKPLAIEDFLAWSVPGTVWGDLLHIALAPRSSSEPALLYYARMKFDRFRPGFNIDDAQIEILGFAADVSLQVGDGVTLEGSVFGPIDFGFLKLSGPQFGDTSPEVDVRRSPTASWFRLSCGVTFLDRQFGAVAVAIEPASGAAYHQFAGRLEYNADIGPFKRPSFAFVWSRRQGFRVTEWPMPDFPGSGLIDYTKVLNELSSIGCAPFVKEMFRTVIETKFDFAAAMDSPNAGSEAEDGAELKFTVTGTFTVSAAGISEGLTVPLPAPLRVSLTKPEEFSFGALAEALERAITAAANDLLQEIIDNPERSAKFFSVVIVQAALPQVISLLVCRGWSAPVPPVPPAPPQPPPPIPPTPPLPPPPTPPSGSPGATRLQRLKYEDGALALAWTSAARAENYFVVLRDAHDMLVQTVATGLSTRIEFADRWPSKNYAANVQGRNKTGSGDWSEDLKIVRLAPLLAPSFEQSGPELLLGWCQSAAPPPYSQAGAYDYAVFDPTGAPLAQGSTAATVFTVKIALPPNARAGVYRAVVRGRAPDGSAVPGQWSEATTLLVDPTLDNGWRVSVDNDLIPSEADSELTATVTDPAVPGWVRLFAQRTTLLLPDPIRGFEIWRSRVATRRARTVEGATVAASRSGTAVTLRWSEIVSGKLPTGFTRTLRRGVLLGEGNLLWADLLTPAVMADGVRPYSDSAGDTATLLVFAYPSLLQADLAAALSHANYGLEDLASALLTVRTHYQQTPTPVTPASVASALAQSWPGPGNLVPAQVADVLIPAFSDHGAPLDATNLSEALVTAFPLDVISVAALVPYVVALRPFFVLAETASGFAAAVPRLSATPLAGSLKTIYLGRTATVADYARSLSATGRTAQEATPVIVGAYPLTSATELAQALIDAFPETAGSTLLVCWCLAIAAVAEVPAAEALVTVEPALGAIPLAGALKTAYPAAAVLRAVADMQAQGVYAVDAAPALARQFSDLTGTQLLWLVMTHFGATAPDALAGAHALAAAAVTITHTAVALRRLYPLLSAAAIAAILKHVYLGARNDGDDASAQ
jgi:hypothetical protein